MASNHHLYYKENPYMTCVVKVGSTSSSRVKRVLSRCHGVVHNFRMDEDGLVEISGTIDPAMLLKGLASTGSRAEIRWLQFGECSNNLFMPGGPTTNCYQGSRFLGPAHPPSRPFRPFEILQGSYPEYINCHYDHHNNNYNNGCGQQGYDNYANAQYYNQQRYLEQRRQKDYYKYKKKYERRQEGCCVVM